MSDERLPVQPSDTPAIFDHRSPSPLAHRGIERLASLTRPIQDGAGKAAYAELEWVAKFFLRESEMHNEVPVWPSCDWNEIPDALLATNLWVPWAWGRLEERFWSPVPVVIEADEGGERYDLNGSRTITEPSRSPWEAATEYAKREGLPGVGMVGASGAPLVLVTIDACRDPNSGHVEEWAMELVAFLATYAEVSLSGRGIRLVAWDYMAGNRDGRLDTCEGDPNINGYRSRVLVHDQWPLWIPTGRRLPGTPNAVLERSDKLQMLNELIFHCMYSIRPAWWPLAMLNLRDQQLFTLPTGNPSLPYLGFDAWASRTDQRFDYPAWAPPSSAVTLLDDLVIARRWDGCDWALDWVTGTVRWKLPHSLSGWRRNGNVLCGEDGTWTYVVEPTTGQILLKTGSVDELGMHRKRHSEPKPGSAKDESSLGRVPRSKRWGATYGNEEVVVEWFGGWEDNLLTGFDSASDAERWRYTDLDSFVEPMQAGGFMVVGLPDGGVGGIDIRTGQMCWQNSEVDGWPQWDDDNLVFVGGSIHSDVIVVLDASTGQRLDKVDEPSNRPRGADDLTLMWSGLEAGSRILTVDRRTSQLWRAAVDDRWRAGIRTGTDRRDYASDWNDRMLDRLEVQAVLDRRRLCLHTDTTIAAFHVPSDIVKY